MEHLWNTANSFSHRPLAFDFFRVDRGKEQGDKAEGGVDKGG